MNSEVNSEMKNESFEGVWRRVREITGWSDYKELAQYLGSSPQSISGVKKRGKFPIDWARRLAMEFGSYTDWLLDGVGPMRREEHEDRGEREASSRERKEYLQGYEAATGGEPLFKRWFSAHLEKDYVLVPRYEVTASAGGGAVVHSEQIVDYLSFKADWIKNGLGLSERDLALINVKGDSMEPTLSNEDLILVDLRTKHVEDNAVYVLLFNGTLLVKRIQRKLDGSVVVKSDNSLYEPEVVGKDKMEDLNVIGRVVWCGRRM